MAISFIQSKTQGNGAAATSIAATWNSNTQDGNFIVVAISSGSGASNNVTSITDSQNNVYTRAVQYYNSGTKPTVDIWYANSIKGGTTPTVTATTVSKNLAMVISEFSGVCYLVETTATTDNSGSPHSSGTTAVNSKAEVLVVAAFAEDNSGSTVTDDPDFADAITIAYAGAGTGSRMIYQYRITSSVEAQNCTITTAVSSLSHAAIVIFRARDSIQFSKIRPNLYAPGIAR